MRNDWKQTTLGEVATLRHGYSFKSGDFILGGKLPVVRIGNIKDWRVVVDDSVSVDEDSQLMPYILRRGDMVIALTGGDVSNLETATGRVGLYQEHLSSVLNQRVARIDIDQNKAEKRFIYFTLANKPTVQALASIANGSAQKNLTTAQVLNFPILLPPLDEQRSIAAVLSSLDDKIELLRAQNKTLEEMAQRLFKEWFVDFNFPNEDGKPYKKSGGRMIESEMGEIPEGWRVSVYSELAHVGTGKNRKKEERFDLGLFPIIGANGELGRTNDYNSEEPAILTGRVGTLGTVYLERRKVWVSDNVLITRAKKKHLLYFLLFVLKSIDLQSLNRGSTQPLITQTDLKNFPIVVPEDGVVQKYTNFAYALFEKVYGNFQQIQTLSNLRDSLLPKLMSGEI